MTLSRPVRFVFFDLDDTLLDHTYAEHAALRTMHASDDQPFGEHPFEDVHAAYSTINPVVWRKYSAGEYTKRQAKVGRFSQLLDHLGLDAAMDEQLAHRYLDTYSRHWKPIDGAMEAFNAISRLLPVGILTNGFTEIQQAKMRQFDTLPMTSRAVVISEEVGVLKPDPDLFAEAALRAGMEAEDILYVGDSLTSDVEGGIGAGWQVAWYADAEHDHPDVFSFSDWTLLTKVVLDNTNPAD